MNPNRRILIVDDQEYNIEALKTILEYSVGLKDINQRADKAFDGQIALNMVKENVQKNGMRCLDYDLIFMDCNMPEMDGYEASLKIREFLYANGIQQPIISAVTGHTEQSYIDKAVNSGMNQVLSKPVPIETLKNLMRKMNYSQSNF